MTCDHSILSTSPSSNAIEVGYCRPTIEQRESAATTSNATHNRKRDIGDVNTDATFPAPLILPGDELSLDPGYPRQSLRSWMREKERNEVIPEKNVIYVAGPPDIEPNVDFIRGWSEPKEQDEALEVQTPQPKDVAEYLEAFYHGLPVKLLRSPKLSFTSWTEDGAGSRSRARPKKGLPKYIGLKASTECIGIRTRPSLDGVFAGQFNLDDLLDVAISILPKDAYALLLLVDHDLFEDEDDAFVCGRAYGGSRVAVVSTARYSPCLDLRQKVEIEHAWPLSHCETYMKACCAEESVGDFLGTKDKTRAIPSESPTSLSMLYLSRICRTASHELGHCFGIDHCVFYACSMQGSASLAEDARQPPYLCPVDLAKILRATGANASDRYRALLHFVRIMEIRSVSRLLQHGLRRDWSRWESDSRLWKHLSMSAPLNMVHMLFLHTSCLRSLGRISLCSPFSFKSSLLELQKVSISHSRTSRSNMVGVGLKYKAAAEVVNNNCMIV